MCPCVVLCVRTFNNRSIQYDYDYSNAYGGIQDVASNSISGATGKRTNQIGGGVINKSPQPLATPVLGIASTGESSVFSDDDSFEKQFGCPEEKIVIHAPAGKLGVVIDTFDGGLAGVNAIKDDSVLADRLKIGDVLISVDGQETAGMTALQVSRLIGQRSEYPRRELIFTRKTQE